MTEAGLPNVAAPLRIIVNGAAVTPRLRARIEAAVARRGDRWEVVVTTGPGDLERMAIEAARAGAPRVVVAGGDGTVHEAANGLAGTETALGIIPAGSGNDFVRTLRVPRRTEEAVACALDGHVRCIDVVDVTCRDLLGRTQTRIFVNIAEVGIGGEVVKLAALARRFAGRALGYHAGMLAALARNRPVPVRLQIDGVEARPGGLNNLIVANGQFFGGGMHPIPHANLDDGRIDVARIRDLGRLSLLRQSPLVLRGLPMAHPNIDHWSAQEVVAESDAWVLVEADGELLGTLPARFRIRPRALRVVCPSPGSA